MVKEFRVSFHKPFWLEPVLFLCKAMLRGGLPIPYNTLVNVTAWWIRKTARIEYIDA